MASSTQNYGSLQSILQQCEHFIQFKKKKLFVHKRNLITINQIKQILKNYQKQREEIKKIQSLRIYAIYDQDISINFEIEIAQSNFNIYKYFFSTNKKSKAMTQKDQIQGSKPKKLNRRKMHTNPSTYKLFLSRNSNEILTIFDPETVIKTERQQIIKRSLSQINTFKLPPLTRNKSLLYTKSEPAPVFEDNFMIKKKLQFPFIKTKQKNPFRIVEDKVKLRSQFLSIGIPNSSYLKKFNFADFTSIKTKQKNSYDIITSLSKIKF